MSKHTKIRCALVRWNASLRTLEEVRIHLLRDGMNPTYMVWIYHGEEFCDSDKELDNNENGGDDAINEEDETDDALPEMLAEMHEAFNTQIPDDTNFESFDGYDLTVERSTT
ncbi:hypothetical protein ACLOJK_018672 [Asimina triloba]